MRELSPPPSSIVDPQGATLRAGSFEGDLPRVDLSGLGKDPLFRFLHEKRWVYVAVASGELFLGLAIVNLGYASKCFYFVFDREKNRLVVDRSLLGPAFLCTVNDLAAEGCEATFQQPLARTRASFTRPFGAGPARVEIRGPELTLDVMLSTEHLPPAIGAVAPIHGPRSGLANATQKVALMPVRGEVWIGTKRHDLAGGLAGYDYTHGYLARRTSWRWAFFLGKAKTGEKVAMNLVEGFVGEPECALWIDGELHPLAEGRFRFDLNNPSAPWIIKTADGAADLRFEPGAVHEERENLLIVASRFLQPVGSYSGSIEVEGRGRIELDRVLGVVEEQDSRW
ncbi:MAG: DUF2804 domain-containing protein [Byssovorax sp.]